MIPILYRAEETEFATRGLGALPDAISCIVTEERNGIFELCLEYPNDGLHVKDLVVDRIILAPPNDYGDWQPFRIYQVVPFVPGIMTVYAEHISYRIQNGGSKRHPGIRQYQWRKAYPGRIPAAGL